MNPTSGVVLTGAVVALGRWSKGETIGVKVVVSVGFLTIVLAVLAEANADFASKMAALVLVAAVFTYGPSIVKKAGLTK